MQLDPFEDPELKSAVKRAFGGGGAPAVLRQRIERMMAQTPAVPRRERWWERLPLRTMAAAAMMLIAVGLAAYRVQQFFAPPQRPQFSQLVLPTELFISMIATHDRCGQFQDHHRIQAPRHDFERITLAMQQELGHPVMAASLREQGWNFVGAAVCRVGELRVAHLLFARNGQTLSVFSMPTPPDCGPGIQQGELVHSDRPIAMLAIDDGLHCVMGHSADGALGLAEVQLLRDVLASSAPGCGGVP